MGIALVYPPVDPPQNMPYWFFSYWESLYNYPDQLVSGTILEDGLRNYSFSGDSKNSLLINYSPELSNCLWVLSPRDTNNREIPSTLQELLSISNLERIHQASPDRNWNPSESIFGPEPQHQWCYYYEKAELASQYEDWDEVIRLMETAEQYGYSPSNKQEYLPWVDAYLKVGNIEAAYKLTTRIRKVTGKIDDQICSVWLNNIDVQQNPDIDQAYEKVKEALSCFD